LACSNLPRFFAEGGDVTDANKKRCPFFYIIDPIMRDRPSIKPLALSDELDWENLENESTEMEVTDLSDFPGVDDSFDEPTMVTITTRHYRNYCRIIRGR